MTDTISCVRCNQTGAPLAKAPFRNELGERILASICQDCWGQWLRFQTQLINHHGLDVRDRPAREFLTTNMEGFLFKTASTEEIDTSRQGKISW